ncbi:MAG: hypothetical protein IKX35_04245 [Bacteroidales bacterium]|jgi:hypothetical protein|nr:hypothetical protein [Bacteroidales bacterium]
MAFFYRHNPKKFNYIPRYYNPEEQAWEEKKAAAGLDSKLTHEEQLRAQMRSKWGAKKDEETKEEQRAKLIRRIVLGVFVVLLFYFVFCTPLMQTIVGGLMGK